MKTFRTFARSKKRFQMFKELLTFSDIELSLAGISVGLFIIQLLYYLVTYSRPLRTFKKSAKGGTFTANPQTAPVSVIVYAKNESVNLREFLPSLLTQDYPNFEVIVVNDGSTDESDDVLKTFEHEYKQLYHTYIPEEVKYLSRKKLALTVGIKAAKHEILLFTEANCQPRSKYWIREMAACYSPETNIVLGFCAYGPYKGFLHKLVAYDNLMTGLQYLASALNNRPYTGNGRNLSYRKELFFAHKGYYKSLNLHAGDDDLFVNESATTRNTAVVYTPDSITEMASVERFSIWMEMKVSRAATQRYYKGWKLTLYRMESCSCLFFLASTIASIGIGICGNWLISILAGVLLLTRFGIKAAVLRKSARMLQQKPHTAWLPLTEVILPLFNVYVRIYRIFRGKNDYTFRLSR